jgi:hypothetical protein
MATRLFCVILALGSVLVSAGSFAQDEEDGDGGGGDYAREGGYVGLGATYVLENVDTDDFEDDVQSALSAAGSPVGNVSIDVDDTWGLNARVGSRFGSRFAMELVGDWFDDADVDVSARGGLDGSADLEAWAVTYNIKGYLLTGRVQPYVLAGGGVLGGELDSSVGSENEYGFCWRLGGGYDFYQTENVVLNLEAAYYLPTGDVRDFDFISVGLGVHYRF